MRKASASVLFLALVISPAIFATGNAEAGKDVFMKRRTEAAKRISPR